MSEMGAVNIAMKAVHKAFKSESLEGSRTLPVLVDLSLDAKANEVLAILGPSGCGKTTILRLLAGIVRPDFGETAMFPSSRKETQIAMAFQDFRLFPWKNAIDNAILPQRLRGLPR